MIKLNGKINWCELPINYYIYIYTNAFYLKVVYAHIKIRMLDKHTSPIIFKDIIRFIFCYLNVNVVIYKYLL